MVVRGGGGGGGDGDGDGGIYGGGTGRYRVVVRAPIILLLLLVLLLFSIAYYTMIVATIIVIIPLVLLLRLPLQANAQQPSKPSKLREPPSDVKALAEHWDRERVIDPSFVQQLLADNIDLEHAVPLRIYGDGAQSLRIWIV